MRLENIEVFIRSQPDGRVLPEYQVETLDDGKTVACYIPSEVGKSFEICWRGDTRGDAHDSSVRCAVDGRAAGGSFCERGVLRGRRWGIRETATLRRPFEFAPLVTTDDDDAAPAGPEAQPDLGSIQVQLAHAVRVRRTGFRAGAAPFQPGAVHERSKKMGVQCVSLGNGRKCEPWPKTHIRLVDERSPGYARFVFRYRAREFLQAEGIMPHEEEAPAPPALERKRRATRSQVDEDEPGSGARRKRARTSPANEVPPTEARADVKPSADHPAASEADDRRRRRSSRGVKHERQDPDGGVIDLTAGDVKRERSPIRLPAAHIGGVIDLTLGDD